MNRKPININNDDAQYEALKAHQDEYIKDNDTHKDSLSFPIWSTVAVQHEDGGPWVHRVIEKANNTNHNGRSNIAKVIKTGMLILQNTGHIHTTLITTE